MSYTIDPRRRSVAPIAPLGPTAGVSVAPVGSPNGSRPAVVVTYSGVADMFGGSHSGITVVYDSGANTLTLTNTDKGSTAVATHEAAADPHPQYVLLAQLQASLAALAPQTFLHCGNVQIVPADIIDGGAHNQTYTLDTYDGGSL